MTYIVCVDAPFCGCPDCQWIPAEPEPVKKWAVSWFDQETGSDVYATSWGRTQEEARLNCYGLPWQALCQITETPE